MITLTKGAESESIFVTFTERLTLQDPLINITFRNVNTNEVINFDIRLSEDDVSQYPKRYNQIVLNTSELMGNHPVGQYTYEAIEVPTGVMIENGKLNYISNEGSVFVENNPTTSYKAYNG